MLQIATDDAGLDRKIDGHLYSKSKRNLHSSCPAAAQEDITWNMWKRTLHCDLLYC